MLVRKDKGWLDNGYSEYVPVWGDYEPLNSIWSDSPWKVGGNNENDDEDNDDDSSDGTFNPAWAGASKKFGGTHAAIYTLQKGRCTQSLHNRASSEQWSTITRTMQGSAKQQAVSLYFPADYRQMLGCARTLHQPYFKRAPGAIHAPVAYTYLRKSKAECILSSLPVSIVNSHSIDTLTKIGYTITYYLHSTKQR